MTIEPQTKLDNHQTTGKQNWMTVRPQTKLDDNQTTGKDVNYSHKSFPLFLCETTTTHLSQHHENTTSREQVDQTEVCNGKSVMYVLVIF